MEKSLGCCRLLYTVQPPPLHPSVSLYMWGEGSSPPKNLLTWGYPRDCKGAEPGLGTQRSTQATPSCDRSRDNTRAERGGAYTIDSFAETCMRSGNGRPAAFHHHINMEYAPLLCVNAAGLALPKALGFLLIVRLLLNLKGYL